MESSNIAASHHHRTGTEPNAERDGENLLAASAWDTVAMCQNDPVKRDKMEERARSIAKKWNKCCRMSHQREGQQMQFLWLFIKRLKFQNGFLRRATEAKEELDCPKYGIGGQEVVAGKGSSKATA